jgi:disulfide oxidoreductase YuzD|tara:strand:+ start:3542 stop:3895 length:354 start_codon:yes stop_codon:yes gene_type:complete
MIFIPTNVPSSKNSKVWTGKFLVSSKATQKWRKETKDYWNIFKKEFIDQLGEKPHKIGFKFIRKSRHKFDYVNPLQTVQDEMVKYGWLEDDSADELIPVFLPYEYDKENPGVEIHVL